MIKNKYKLLSIFALFSFLTLFQTTAQAEEEKNFWWKLWGNTGPTNLYTGMWSYHVFTDSQDNQNNNPTFAVATHGFFLGTFVNSFYQQSVAGGIQRYWYDKTYSNDLNLRLGYRLGVIYGYHNINPNNFIGKITKNQPLVPLPQVISELTWHHVGVQVGYSGDVFSATFYLSV